MDHQDLLQTFAEVAVAFAGFSAVVSIFDRRAEDDDPAVRHYRVRVMVEYSLCVTIFAFVPYLLNAVLASEGLAWRISSLLLAISWSVVGLQSRSRARTALGRSVWSAAPAFSGVATAIGWIGAGILVANAAGIPIRSAGTSYILGLFLPLLQSALYFLRIVAHGEPLRREKNRRGAEEVRGDSGQTAR